MQSDVNYVHQEAFDMVVQSVSNKLAYLEDLAVTAIKRQEVLLKVMSRDGQVPSMDAFVEGLAQYDPFVKALREIRSIPKISARIEAAVTYNEANPTGFAIMADDINVLEQSLEAESVSKSNLNKALTLPHTKNFVTRMLPLLNKPE